MILQTTARIPATPAKVELNGSQGFTLAMPQALKIQTTGPGAEELLHYQCAPGETCYVTVWVRVEVSNT